jgi:hypothetical protein
MHLYRAIASAALGVLVAACAAGFGPPPVAQARNVERPPAGSTEFKRGYADGCMSGQANAQPGGDAIYTINKKLFQTSPDYAAGWTQGQKACYDDWVRNPPRLP